MKLKTTIAVGIDHISQSISLDTHWLQPVDNVADDLISRHICEVIKLRDEAVRDALIQLGWTPPHDAKPLVHSARSQTLDLQGDDNAA